jgi:predicted enzyme related to lactoylglutathione lyase
VVAVEVDDVDACAKKTMKHGGKVHQPPETVAGHGHYAILVDPQDAPFTVWSTERAEQDRERTPGDWHWTELWTDDPKSAVEF